ncbi:MAG TPA: aminotransferase class I/II-fold pyridoxal phosphate-dependent enzyme [Thermoleophilia bacterium]|nr:aminotransferase class I/II-fold pyridoxal phosphate-dependent enzyme [Thermoleophilia bacterium]
MKYVRMPIEVESPEEFGYDKIKYNLSESSVRDRTLSDVGIELGDMVLYYGEHMGHQGLMELIAQASSGPAGAAEPADVLVTAGAAQALFIIATTLLEKGDHLVVVRPNYATNIFTPRAIEADISYLELTFEDEWRVDVDALIALMTPRTRYVSITVPHNPTGQMMNEADLRRLLRIVEERGCRLLVDETYREMTFGGPLPVTATLSPQAISVSSLSKTYGIPGIRTGWLICKDHDLMQTFLGAKEQIGICGSVVDEEIAYQALRQRDAWLPEINGRIQEALAITREWMDGEELMEWVEPKGGVVGFPRIKLDVPLDVDRFYTVLTEEFGTYVGPGHWFEQSRRHFRLGFGWPTLDELRGGLAGISGALRASLTG